MKRLASKLFCSHFPKCKEEITSIKKYRKKRICVSLNVIGKGNPPATLTKRNNAELEKEILNRGLGQLSFTPD